MHRRDRKAHLRQRKGAAYRLMPQKYAKVPPQHVAVIMDGNGRWAKKRLLPRAAGHRAGFRRMLSLVDHIFACGIRYCTLFALSCENLNRPREEIEGLFEIFREYFGKHIAPLVEKGIALRVLGDAALVPPDIAASMREAEKKTSAGKNGVLTVAIGDAGSGLFQHPQERRPHGRDRLRRAAGYRRRLQPRPARRTKGNARIFCREAFDGGHARG